MSLKHQWNIADTIMGIFLAAVIGFGMFFTYLFSNVYILNQQPAEASILFKMGEKGFYFGPFYKVVTESGQEQRITKDQFYEQNLETIAGYKTDTNPFFTALDLRYELMSLMIILFVLCILCLLMICYFYHKFSGKKKCSFYRELKTRFKKVIPLLLMIYIVISMVILLFVMKNMLPQFIPLGHTYTNAKIIDREITKRYGRYRIDRYDLVIAYADEQENEYLVKKRVDYQIYDKYKHDYGIPIHYANNNPANVFIHFQSFKELFSILTLFESIFILFIPYSYVRIYKSFRRASQAHG